MCIFVSKNKFVVQLLQLLEKNERLKFTYRKTIRGPMQIISHAAIVPSMYCVRCSRDASLCASYKSYERRLQLVRAGTLRNDDDAECLCKHFRCNEIEKSGEKNVTKMYSLCCIILFIGKNSKKKHTQIIYQIKWIELQQLCAHIKSVYCGSHSHYG